MHMLNGMDNLNDRRIRRAVSNCTNDELTLLDSGVDKLWDLTLLPETWRPTKALYIAKNRYAIKLRAAVKAEKKMRKGGKKSEPDLASRNTLVRVTY